MQAGDLLHNGQRIQHIGTQHMNNHGNLCSKVKGKVDCVNNNHRKGGRLHSYTPSSFRAKKIRRDKDKHCIMTISSKIFQFYPRWCLNPQNTQSKTRRNFQRNRKTYTAAGDANCVSDRTETLQRVFSGHRIKLGSNTRRQETLPTLGR